MRSWILYNIRKLLKVASQSPNTNIIENVWDHLTEKNRNRRISSRNY